MTDKSKTRFAPSPTGRLHLGHAFSALTAHGAAGEFLLRIEDIDQTRCRPEFESALKEDLKWLGLTWPEPVRRQSEFMADYAEALQKLETAGLLYPCFCTRKDIAREIENAGAAPHGPDGPVYPGLCKGLSAEERERRKAAGERFAVRLDMDKAITAAGRLHWFDREKGKIAAEPEKFGDVVLARKETPTSYHLSVTVDDWLQGITLVVRGEDLFESTHVHRLLQALLGFEPPEYLHHRLLTDADGKRLAKRNRSATIADLRAQGMKPEEVVAMAKGLLPATG